MLMQSPRTANPPSRVILRPLVFLNTSMTSNIRCSDFAFFTHICLLFPVTYSPSMYGCAPLRGLTIIVTCGLDVAKFNKWGEEDRYDRIAADEPPCSQYRMRSFWSCGIPRVAMLLNIIRAIYSRVCRWRDNVVCRTEVFLSDEMGSLRGKPQSALVFYLPLACRDRLRQSHRMTGIGGLVFTPTPERMPLWHRLRAYYRRLMFLRHGRPRRFLLLCYRRGQQLAMWDALQPSRDNDAQRAIQRECRAFVLQTSNSRWQVGLRGSRLQPFWIRAVHFQRPLPQGCEVSGHQM